MLSLAPVELFRLTFDAVQTPHKARQAQINKYTACSRLTVLLYDIVLNLPRERQLVWEAPLRTSSIIYYMARYPPIAYEAFTVFYTPGVTPHCDAWEKFTWAISLVPTRLAVVASFVLRVYAVTDKGLPFILLLSLIGLLIIVLDIWQDAVASCTAASDPVSSVLKYISLVLFDVLSTGLISWSVARIIQKNGGFKKTSGLSLYSLILRSGFIYYLVITAPQVGSIILYFLPQGVYSLALDHYIIVLSSILVARFLLDLRSMANRGIIGDSTLGSDAFDPRSMAFGLPTQTTLTCEQGTSSSAFQNLVIDFSDPELSPNSKSDDSAIVISRGTNAPAGTSFSLQQLRSYHGDNSTG